ncbi:MAG: nuclear transport factor 2 family protein [Clostridiales Family XIII bacterium]|jgi:hypothetical protein|nr:nuclear transport factor 2 family protein [Clostridiales Family XIII bacterium]
MTSYTHPTYSTEQLVERWESQREIKNLMGKYANCVILNREDELFDAFWAGGENDVCLVFNDGYYKGAEAVRSYYMAERERNALVSKLLRDRFPEQLGGKNDDEIYGIGPFKVNPMACPVIEIAGDNASAKGLWYCQGAYNKVEECGPLAHWTWGFFAVDFINKDGAWRILHLQQVNDVDSICGMSWGRPQKIPSPLPEFMALADFRYPAYTESVTIREQYNPRRPFTGAPRIPEPYETFSETFSYGIEEV